MLPLFITNVIKAIRDEKIRKERLFDSFQNSEESLKFISDAVTSGNIMKEDGDNRVKVIILGAKILKEMPLLNSRTGKPFTYKESVNWLNDTLKRIGIEIKKNQISDENLDDFYETKIKQLHYQNSSS